MLKQIITSVAACAATVAATAQTPLPTDTATLIGKLPNGLTYIIRHNEHPANRADFYIAQKVGAVLEEDTQDGLAHFLEHMAFNGTKNFPDKGIIDYLETLGVKFGENINAYTSLDETVYNLKNVPTIREGIVDSALLVLHDWSGFISLESEEIDNERGVIREEWRTGNGANRRMFFAHRKVTMAGTPYATRDVIGDTAVINNFKYEELRAYYRKWYRPDLQGIIVVGDIDPKAIEQKIKDMWSDIPAPVDAAERVYFKLNKQEAPIVSIVTDKEAQNSTIQISLRGERMPDAVRNTVEGYATMLAVNLMTDVLRERFADLIQKPTAPFVRAYSYYGDLTPVNSSLEFAAVAKKGQVTEAYTMLVDEIEKLRRYGVTTAELERVKTNTLKAYEDEYNGRAQRPNGEYVYEFYRAFLDGDALPGIENTYDLVKMLTPHISKEMINSIAQQLLTGDMCITVSAPADETLPTEAQILEMFGAAAQKELEAYKEEVFGGQLVDETPKAGKVKKATEGAFGTTVWTLSNGIKVVLKPTTLKDDEIVFNAVSLGGYSLCEPSEVLSTAYSNIFAAQMGIGKYSVTELRKILAGKSLRISPNILIDSEVITGYCTAKDFGTLMQGLHLSFGKMRRDADAFATTKEMYRTMLINKANDANNAFSDTIRATLASATDYITKPISIDVIESFDMETMLTQYENRFANPADFTFVFVGDFNPDSIKSDIETWLGSLATTKKRETAIDRNVAYPAGVVDKTFAREMATNKTSSYTAYHGAHDGTQKSRLAISILSDLLDMRYLDTIRESEGGSYGVSCYANTSAPARGRFGLFMVFDTDPDKFARLYPIIEREIETIAQEGPSAVDFAKVKENLIKKHAEQLQKNDMWLSTISTYYLRNEDVHTNYESTVNAITPDDIKAAAEMVLKSGKISVTMNPITE